MPSFRQIRRRIRSIQNTKQIMRAMQLVSGSKFKRAQSRLMQSRVVLEFLDGLLQRVLAASPDLQHPLTTHNEQAPSALLVVTSDTGLAGSYNTNLIQLAEAELRRDSARRTELNFLGKKGSRYFSKRGYAAKEAWLGLAGRPDIKRIDEIGQQALGRFLSGQIGSVKLLYARFVSPMVSKPTVRQWLPIQLERTNGPTGDEANRLADEYIFEPSAQAVFEDLLPRWAMATFRCAILEAFTSEHGARMIAMKNATDNAEELVGTLTLQRNKLRQTTITKELSEIVGTAEALK